MPPKKKVEENGDDADRSLLSVDDYTLPKSMILRLAKGVLPPNTQIQKDALTAILKSTTVFVNYLASNADDRAQLANKKTIRPEDVFGALEEVEFGGFVDRVQKELNKYQLNQNDKRNVYRARIKQDRELDADGNPKPEDTENTGQSLDMDTQSEGSQREKSTTPRIVTLHQAGDTDDTDADTVDEPPAAKRARTSHARDLRTDIARRSAKYYNHDDNDDTANDETISAEDNEDDVDDVDDEDELEYQSAEEEVAEEEIEDNETIDEDEQEPYGAHLNPDPEDDDPGGSEED